MHSFSVALFDLVVFLALLVGWFCVLYKGSYKSLLLAAIYEQYLLSRLAKGKSPFSYRSASSFRTLSQIGFFPLNNALRYGVPFSSVNV